MMSYCRISSVIIYIELYRQLFVCLFVFLALQPTVVVFSQPSEDFSLLVFGVS